MKEIANSHKDSQQPESDNSFEVRWSLQELENIVYDFINYKGLRGEESQFGGPPTEAIKEEVMKVQRRDKNSEDLLPQFVRDLILHDRGNSIFLSDSFANLPSPVNETATIKRIFKGNKGGGQGGGEAGSRKESGAVKKIQFEGDSEGEGDHEDSRHLRKNNVNLDCAVFDKLVFQGADESTRQIKPY